jgi:hypothetical protein
MQPGESVPLPIPGHAQTRRVASGSSPWNRAQPRQRLHAVHAWVLGCFCSPEAVSTGACTFNIESPPGGSPLPLAQPVASYDLTTAEGIQAAAKAGLVVLIDTGAVFLGVVSG